MSSHRDGNDNDDRDFYRDVDRLSRWLMVAVVVLFAGAALFAGWSLWLWLGTKP